MAAAAALFAELGPNAVSMRDVAAAAELSHPGALRHFPTKDALVDAVVTELEGRVSSVVETLPAGVTAADIFTAVGTVDGFAALSTVLARGREFEAAQRRVLALWATLERRLRATGSDAAEATRVVAMTRGLQLIDQYVPVAPRLRTGDGGAVDGRVRGPGAGQDAGPGSTVTSLSELVVDEHDGYDTGRRRRAEILARATTQFARAGYHGTSVRAVAADAGISAATLLHHFGSKEALLVAVLRQRDVLLAARGTGEHLDAATELSGLGSEARRDAVAEPGLVELYAVLVAEASPRRHAAHAFLAERYRRTIGYFTHLFDDARAGSRRTSGVDALLLVALWDGLELISGSATDLVAIGDHLDAHLAAALPPGRPQSAADRHVRPRG